MRGWRGCNSRSPDSNTTNVALQVQPLLMLVRCLPAVSGQQREAVMPYRRGGFALTPPSVFIFLVSLALAAVAMLVYYAHTPMPIINTSHVFDLLAIAYVVLTIGVLFRRV